MILRQFLSQIKNGLNNKATKGIIIELPIKLTKNAVPILNALSPQSEVLIAKGIAPLSSKIGNIAINIVASIGLLNFSTKNSCIFCILIYIQNTQEL